MTSRKNKTSKFVSIVVPIYKQEKTVKKDLINIINNMERTRWDFELVAVVDGFVDGSFSEAKTLEKEFPENKIRVYGYKNNKGKGYAVRYGIARARGYYVSFIDSGMDIDPNGISMLLEHMEWYDADIIVGSKKHPVSKVQSPFIRKVYSFCYHSLVRFLFGLKISDTQTGLKVFKLEVLEKVMPRLLIKQFAFDVELLAVSNHLGYKKIYEAPIQICMDTDRSVFSPFFIFDRNIRKMLLDTLAVFYRLRILRFYDDSSKRKWFHDKDLDLRINTGEFTHD